MIAPARSAAATSAGALLVEPGSVITNAREFVRLNGLGDRFQLVRACIGDGQPVTFYESKSSTRSSSAIAPNSREKTAADGKRQR